MEDELTLSLTSSPVEIQTELQAPTSVAGLWVFPFHLPSFGHSPFSSSFSFSSSVWTSLLSHCRYLIQHCYEARHWPISKPILYYMTGNRVDGQTTKLKSVNINGLVLQVMT